MVSFRGQKKLGPRPDPSPLGDLIQNFQRASPPLLYASPSPREITPMGPVSPELGWIMANEHITQVYIIYLWMFRKIGRLAFPSMPGLSGKSSQSYKQWLTLSFIYSFIRCTKPLVRNGTS